MLSAVRLIAALGLLLLGAVAAATDELVAVPSLKARVTDLTGTLGREQAASLETELAQFEQARGSQIAILLVPSTRPETIEEYSIRVAESWKLGRKGIDDGILILVAKGDRKLRIEVGRGLEGAVPDAVAKRIVAEVIGPRFKEGDFHGGLKAGVAKLQSAIAGEALPPPKSTSPSRGGMDIETLLVVSLVIATMLGAVMGRLMGRLGGSTVTSGVVGTLAWLVTDSALAALIGAILVFIYVLAFASSGRGGGWSSGGWSSGGGGGWSGGSSDGGFSGGGGDFGGGGASGDW